MDRSQPQFAERYALSPQAHTYTHAHTRPPPHADIAQLAESLKPTQLDLVNDSHKHAGHSAMRGVDSAETHFLYVTDGARMVNVFLGSRSCRRPSRARCRALLALSINRALF